MVNSETNGGAAVLVGRLIRSYRNDGRRNGRKLSQDGLLEFMVERGESYAAKLDRVNVSHWETGARLAPREFLIAFGRAFDIPQGEMDRILGFAGYGSMDGANGDEAALTATQGIKSRVESLEQDVRNLVGSAVEPEPRVNAPAVVKSALWRMAPPGIWILGAGFYFNAMDINGTLILVGYVVIALAIAVGHGALRWLNRGRDLWDREHIVDLFFISLFFTLNTQGLIAALTKADLFGFYTVEGFTNTPMPFLFAMLVNLQLSLVASVMFSLLWSRRHAAKGGDGVLSRAAWITLPPLLFAWANIVVFTNLGAWMYFLIIFGILFGAFTIIVALDESEATLGEMRVVLKALIVAMAILTSLGFAGTLMGYIDPGMTLTSAEFRIIPLPEISAEELGYTSEEGVKLIGLGILWKSLAAFLYLVIVVGGHLAMTIRRVNSSGDTPTVPGRPASGPRRPLPPMRSS